MIMTGRYDELDKAALQILMDYSHSPSSIYAKLKKTALCAK